VACIRARVGPDAVLDPSVVIHGAGVLSVSWKS
jgi:hypothetical protein